MPILGFQKNIAEHLPVARVHSLNGLTHTVESLGYSAFLVFPQPFVEGRIGWLGNIGQFTEDPFREHWGKQTILAIGLENHAATAKGRETLSVA